LHVVCCCLRCVVTFHVYGVRIRRYLLHLLILHFSLRLFRCVSWYQIGVDVVVNCCVCQLLIGYSCLFCCALIVRVTALNILRRLRIAVAFVVISCVDSD